MRVIASPKEHRATAHALDGDTIDQVSILDLLPSTDLAAKTTQGFGTDARVAKPADLNLDLEMPTAWPEWYGILWKLKSD